MSGSVALLLMASAVAASPAAAEAQPGVQIASAGVSVEILRPAIVRQGGGWERVSADAPEPLIVRRDGMVLIEFQ